jgi:hypothetical protein
VEAPEVRRLSRSTKADGAEAPVNRPTCEPRVLDLGYRCVQPAVRLIRVSRLNRGLHNPHTGISDPWVGRKAFVDPPIGQTSRPIADGTTM